MILKVGKYGVKVPDWLAFNKLDSQEVARIKLRFNRPDEAKQKRNRFWSWGAALVLLSLVYGFINGIFITDNLYSAKVSAGFGYGLAILWFLMYRMIDVSNGRLHKELLETWKWLETIVRKAEETIKKEGKNNENRTDSKV